MERKNDVLVVCSECGERHAEYQEPDHPWSPGDYGEFWCEMCGCETEHWVAATEEGVSKA